MKYLFLLRLILFPTALHFLKVQVPSLSSDHQKLFSASGVFHKDSVYTWSLQFETIRGPLPFKKLNAQLKKEKLKIRKMLFNNKTVKKILILKAMVKDFVVIIGENNL